MNDILSLTDDVKTFAKAHVNEARFEHSVRTANMCARLCRFYGLDESLGYLAGVGHDICKDFDDSELLRLSALDGNEISEIEKNKPSLLHGRAASIVLKKEFGIKNSDLLEAVAVHTFGKIDMCDLSKCLYIADKIEPGREHVTDEYLERLFKLSLDKMLLTVIEESISFLKGKGKKVAPETEKLVGYLREKN